MLALIADLPSLADDLVAPAFETLKTEGPAQVGQSRFGGMPDVSADFVWPLSDGFTVRDATEEFDTGYSQSLMPLDNALPLTFIAQLDLSTLSPETTDLPNEGRLLFFIDYGVWFQDEDKTKTKIIWDQTPVDDLTRHAPPRALVWLDGLARQNWQAFQDSMKASFGDGHEEAPFNIGFLPPETQVQLNWNWKRLPSHAVEVVKSEFNKRREATGAADIYHEVGMEWPQEDEDQAPPYHQVLGAPFPEQDDPRYDAYLQSVLGLPAITSEDFDEVRSMIGREGTAVRAEEAEQALKFQLLLQLDVASFLDANAEGQFYFFLHEDDLAARNFDAVIVIYQQT